MYLHAKTNIHMFPVTSKGIGSVGRICSILGTCMYMLSLYEYK